MSHKNCPDCRDSVVSRTVSKIASPICNDDCPQDIVCPDIRPSNCTFYSGANLSCSGINFSDTITLALTKIDAQLCSNQSNNCLFKISGDDTCCGYFESKVLAGTGITFTTNNAGTCETLTISQGCNTWNTVGNTCVSPATGCFRDKWKNASAFLTDTQVAQYSNVIGCTIKLRGLIYKDLNAQCLSSIIFQLPINYRPPSIRTYSVVLSQPNVLGGCSTFANGWITINTSGEVIISSTTLNGVWVVSLDGIFFEV